MNIRYSESKYYLDSFVFTKEEFLDYIRADMLRDVFSNPINLNIDVQKTKKIEYNLSPSQTIYYGVPGCGKSYAIKQKLESVPDYNKIRIVFHPEYTNADFIGQILPEIAVDMDGKSVVNYAFRPGPFSKIVRRAYLNPGEAFYLIIEEINRGNAAAIFGETFQLLDRLKPGESDSSGENIYGAGFSSYGIDNPDINAYIRCKEILDEERNDKTEKHSLKATGEGEDSNPKYYKTVDVSLENNKLHISANTAIRLPSNLSVYATMNTSDQNVFTLDNAFQRRFEMKLIKNDWTSENENERERIEAQRDAKIENTEISWSCFLQIINEEIGKNSANMGLSTLEDKRLGCFFVQNKETETEGKKENIILSENFKNKVLKYLWDDAFRFSRESVFSENYSSFEALQKEYEKIGLQIFKCFENFKPNQNSEQVNVENESAINENAYL